MEEIKYSRLLYKHIPQLKEFCRINWGQEHPLIHNEDMFNWYYHKDNLINMVIAYTGDTQGIDILGVCGYILTNTGEHPDVFLSYILSKKGVKATLSLRLIEYILEITKARTINCNNIRKKTKGIYEFLGYTVAGMQHFYRLNPEIMKYSLCKTTSDSIEIKKGSGNISVIEILCADDLNSFPFEEYQENRPYKDKEYVIKRYVLYPFHKYMIFRLFEGIKEALLVIRKIEYEFSVMLRIVDFIGDRELIKKSGPFVNRLIQKHKAEYCDWYVFGINEADMKEIGFSSVNEDKGDIFPLYLSPPVMENTEITIFVSNPEGFLMFRADGDQDRPNLG